VLNRATKSSDVWTHRRHMQQRIPWRGGHMRGGGWGGKIMPAARRIYSPPPSCVVSAGKPSGSIDIVCDGYALSGAGTNAHSRHVLNSQSLCTCGANWRLRPRALYATNPNGETLGSEQTLYVNMGTARVVPQRIWGESDDSIDKPICASQCYSSGCAHSTAIHETASGFFVG